MDVDVKIYVSNFIKFFTDNPNELASVIGQASSDDFYREVELAAYENYEKGEDIELTQKQLINIVLRLNHMQPEEEEKVSEKLESMGPVMETSYGLIFLN